MMNAIDTHCLNLEGGKKETLKHFPKLLKCLKLKTKKKSKLQYNPTLFLNVCDHICDITHNT